MENPSAGIRVPVREPLLERNKVDGQGGRDDPFRDPPRALRQDQRREHHSVNRHSFHVSRVKPILSVTW